MYPNRYPANQQNNYGRKAGKSRDKYKNRSKSPSYYIQQAQQHGYGVPPPPSFYGVSNPTGYGANRPKANTMGNTNYAYGQTGQSRQYGNVQPAQGYGQGYPLPNQTGTYGGGNGANYSYNLQGYGQGYQPPAPAQNQYGNNTNQYANNIPNQYGNNANQFSNNLNPPAPPAYSQNSSTSGSQRRFNDINSISNNLNLNKSDGLNKDRVFKPAQGHARNQTYGGKATYQNYGSHYGI